MTVLPAIDLRGGRTVRLINGDYDREIPYDLDPVDVALEFDAAGAEWIHVVDLDAAKSGTLHNLETVRRIAQAVRCRVEVGGGVRTREAALRVLDAGAGRVVMGTVLVNDPELSGRIFREFGDRVVAGVDAKAGKVAAEGWIGDTSINAAELVTRMTELGAKRFIVTDIATDGALTGPNLKFLREMVGATDAAVIASGGVATLADIGAVGELGGIEGVIVGRAIYEGRFNPVEAIRSGRSDLPGRRKG